MEKNTLRGKKHAVLTLDEYRKLESVIAETNVHKSS